MQTETTDGGRSAARFSGLDHIGFTVSDLDRSVAWYSTFLGAPPFLRDTWDIEYLGRVVGYRGAKLEAAFWTLPGSSAILELLCYHRPTGGTVDMETYNAGNAHLCLTTRDLAADFDRLGDIAEFRDPEPTPIPWGPYQGGWACYLRDPDGISVELIELPPGGRKGTS
jgi:catechol 2,3-dioxygenase-like lactoylglutathione lyase family enzyme